MTDILSFTQWLITLNLSASSIHNNLTAIKTVSLWLGVNSSLWQLPSWKWNRNSVSRVVRKEKKQLATITFVHFIKLMLVMKDKSWTPIRMALILAYFSLLRVSNYTIKNKKSLDLKRNTLLRDITIDRNALRVEIKWAKQIQSGQDFILLPKGN